MGPVLTVVIGWLVNERSRRQAEHERRFAEQYQRKEKSYRRLLENSKGFNEGQPEAPLLRQAFLDELQLCWLHASDEVISKAYAFLDSVHTAAGTSAAERERAFAEFVASLRQDALSQELVTKSRLGAQNYRLLKTT